MHIDIYVYTHACIHAYIHTCIYIYIEREREKQDRLEHFVTRDEASVHVHDKQWAKH